jgi:ATP-dependent Lhr-like helicase
VLLQSSGEEFDREVEVGSVDELFADHLQAGDRFLLDGRCLECRDPGPGDLLVRECPGRPTVPRWHSEQQALSGDLARRIFLLRAQAAEAMRDGPPALHRLLVHEYRLGAQPAAALADFFRLQEAISEIPDQRTCLVECVCQHEAVEYYIHTPLAHAANDALARVATLRLARDLGMSAVPLVADLGLALLFRRSAPLTVDEIRRLLDARGFEADLDLALSDSITLRERFRRVATVGLMILRQPLGQKRRVGGQDWAERRLFDKLRAVEPNFVLLRQAIKEARALCDRASARDYVELLPRLDVKWRQLAAVSPFAACWTQQLAGPVIRPDGPAEVLQRLHATLHGEAMAS